MLIRAKFKDVIVLPETDGEKVFIKGRFGDYMNDPTGTSEFKFSFDLQELFKDWYGANKEFNAKLKFIGVAKDA